TPLTALSLPDALPICSALAELGPQGKHHVEHHADAREALARKRAAGLIGIDDGSGARQLRTGQMVIGDDHLDADPPGRGYALDRSEEHTSELQSRENL